MDRTEQTVRNMLRATEAPLYDVGVLSDRGMLPGLEAIASADVIARLSLLKHRNARGSHIYLRPFGEHRYTVLNDLSEAAFAKLAADGFAPCAVVETSVGNFQAWLKHAAIFPKLIGTFAAQTLASRYGADPSAADWRRFGRLPASLTASQSTGIRTDSFPLFSYAATPGSSTPQPKPSRGGSRRCSRRGSRREAQRVRRSLSPRRGPGFVSLERFRTSTKYKDRPAAADIAFCVAAYVNGMSKDQIERALEDDYLSRDPSPSKRNVYIRRTMAKASSWSHT